MVFKTDTNLNAVDSCYQLVDTVNGLLTLTSASITTITDLSTTVGIASLDAANQLISGLASTIVVHTLGPSDLFIVPDVEAGCKYP